jgi:hypothetical protein
MSHRKTDLGILCRSKSAKVVLWRGPKRSSKVRGMVVRLPQAAGAKNQASFFLGEETVFWFATWYSILAKNGWLLVQVRPASTAILHESIVLMVANSTDSFNNLKPFQLFVVTVHTAIGLMMTIFLVARFISS